MDMTPNNNKPHCHKCNTPLDLEVGQSVHRSEECPKCFADIHCCKMCQFYDKSAYNECREPSAQRITEKEKANFCDYFKLNGVSDGGSGKVDPFAAANALFKD